MTHITHRQEEFSRAYVHAIASAAGLKVQPGATPDDDSVDLTISARGPRGLVRSPRVDVQLKCWIGQVEGDALSYALKLKNYEDLRPPMAEFQVPRILVLVAVPQDPGEWATHTSDSLILRYRAYWTCLHGEPETANTTVVTVKIPAANELTTAWLSAMMARVGQGGRP
jgi:hypothetical protein